MNQDTLHNALAKLEDDFYPQHNVLQLRPETTERLGPLASEAVLRVSSDTATAVEGVASELLTEIHALSVTIQTMNEDTQRALNELDSLMKSTLVAIENTARNVRNHGEQRAKLIASTAETLRRVEAGCRTMVREFEPEERQE